MKNDLKPEDSKQSVSELLARIDENQQIQAKFYDFEFQLLSCKGLPELLDALLNNAPNHFELSTVSLVLYDPDYSLDSLLELLDVENFENRLQLRYSEDFFLDLYGPVPTVKLGELDVLTKTRLFPGTYSVESAALLPLMRQERQIGSLHLGSDSAERYTADKAVSFMTHLALIVSVCLENCIAFEQLEQQGLEDSLTKVRNRRSFEDEFAKEIERAFRQQESLTTLFIDIDHFKNINDSYGHQVGDRCLRQVAKNINGELRKTDLLARYGGEEFVALLPHCYSDEAYIIAERVRLAVVNSPFELNKEESIPLTVSVGLATWDPKNEVAIVNESEVDRQSRLSSFGEKLISKADNAMYRAKQAGRNQVCIAKESSN
ncbi:GGDEF domain-containing protein [Aurantivibrio infirmus]